MQNRHAILENDYSQKILGLIGQYIPEEEQDEIKELIQDQSLDRKFKTLKKYYPFTPFPIKLANLKQEYRLSLQFLNQHHNIPVKVGQFFRGQVSQETQQQYDQYSYNRRFGNLV